jgi:hypothetical protein
MMMRKHRRYLLLSSPVLLSLACASSSFLGAFSLDDLVIEAPQPFVLEEDKKREPSHFKANLESLTSILPTIFPSFPILLLEQDSIIRKEFLCSHYAITDHGSFLLFPLLYKDIIPSAHLTSSVSESFLKIIKKTTSKSQIILSSPMAQEKRTAVVHSTEEIPSLSDILEHPLHFLDPSLAEELLTPLLNFRESPESNSLSLSSFFSEVFPLKTELSTEYTASLISQSFLSIASNYSLTLPLSSMTSVLQAATYHTELIPPLSSILSLPLHALTLFEKESAAVSSIDFNLYPQEEMSSLYSLLVHYDVSSPEPTSLLPKYSLPFSSDIFVKSHCSEELSSHLKPYTAAQESFEYPCSACIKDFTCTPDEISQAPLLSFNHQESSPVFARPISAIVPLSSQALPRSIYLHLDSTFKIKGLLSSESAYFSKDNRDPSFEPYVNLPMHDPVFTPATPELFEKDSLAFSYAFPVADLLVATSHTTPFEEDKISLNRDHYDKTLDNAFISHLFYDAPISISYSASEPAPLSFFTPSTQEGIFNYSSIPCRTSLHELADSMNFLEPNLAFIDSMISISSPYIEYTPSLIKRPLYFLTEDKTIDLPLMTQASSLLALLDDFSFDASFESSLLPIDESSPKIGVYAFPFFHHFYDTIESSYPSFTFPIAAHVPFLTCPLNFNYDVKLVSFDLSGCLEPLSSFMDALSDTQSFSCACAPNPQPSHVNPDQELLTRLSPPSTSPSNPENLIVFYDLTKEKMSFLPVIYQDHLPYIHSPSSHFMKYSMCPYQCNLLTDSKMLSRYFPASSHLKNDSSLATAVVKAKDEHSSLFTYQDALVSAIKKEPFTIEPGSTIPSKLPKLFLELNPIPALIMAHQDLAPLQQHATSLNQNSRNIQKNLAKLPSLKDLRTLSLSEEFSVDLEVTPNSKEKGYLFSITLEPVANKLISGASQNFVFLVDRSSAIDKNRFLAFKQAISKALLYLKEEDTFNILTFDTEISRMSRESVFVNASTKHSAKRFLETQKRGYKFVAPNLYHILLSVHQMTKNSPLPTTVVLMTSGKTLENFDPQDEYLTRFISANHNGFTLFTACSSQNDDTFMLEVLSHLNKGEFMHSQTNAAFPRKLASFVKHAGYLLAKDVHISAAQSNPDVTIEFFPQTDVAPNLYGDRPYTIIGKMDKLSDFDLVLQGRFADNWLNITKKISFKNARNGGLSIYKDYTMHVAYNKYRTYLKEGNVASLNEAKKVFQPFHSSMTY